MRFIANSVRDDLSVYVIHRLQMDNRILIMIMRSFSMTSLSRSCDFACVSRRSLPTRKTFVCKCDMQDKKRDCLISGLLKGAVWRARFQLSYFLLKNRIFGQLIALISRLMQLLQLISRFMQLVSSIMSPFFNSARNQLSKKGTQCKPTKESS